MKLNECSHTIQLKEEEILDLRTTVKSMGRDLVECRDKLNKYKTQVKQLQLDNKRYISDRSKGGDMQLKLQQAGQHNEALFQDYQQVLIQNQNYQQQIIDLQDQINAISYRLRESEHTIKLIRDTESKVNYLEMDLDRLEEQQKYSIPDLQQQMRTIRSEQRNDLEVLNCGVDYISMQFKKSISTLTKQLSMIQKYSKNNVLLVSNQLGFVGLSDIASHTNNKQIQQILNKLNFSESLQSWIEAILTFTMINAQEIVTKQVERKMDNFNHKIQQLESLVVRMATAQDFSTSKKHPCELSTFSAYSNSIISKKKTMEKENDDPQLYQKYTDYLDIIMIKLDQQYDQFKHFYHELDKLVSGKSTKPVREIYSELKQNQSALEQLQQFLRRDLGSLKKDLFSTAKSWKYGYMPKNI